MGWPLNFAFTSSKLSLVAVFWVIYHRDIFSGPVALISIKQYLSKYFVQNSLKMLCQLGNVVHSFPKEIPKIPPAPWDNASRVTERPQRQDVGCALFPSSHKHLFLLYSGSDLWFLAAANQNSLEDFQLMKEKNQL